MSAPGVAWGETDGRARLTNDDGETVTMNPTAALLYGTSTKGRPIGGRYRVEKLLGSGSAGFVVSARHVVLQQKVTLKILHPTRGARRLAQRRALAHAHVAANLRNEHVARVVDTGFADDGAPFVATEYLEGHTLADEMRERRLPAAEAVAWVLQACAGIAEAHAAGIVHGDLKPRNLFLAERGGTRILKILDFGMISPMEEAGEDTVAPWHGSPAYVAPEQIQAGPGYTPAPAVDLWALGVVLHELLAGSLPFAADSVSGTLVAIAYDDPPLAAGADVSLELAKIVRSCLEKDPAQRPRDAVALARALAPFAGPRGANLSRAVADAAERGSESAHASVSAMTLDTDADVRPATEIAHQPAPRALGDRRARPTAHPMGSNLAFRLLERQQKVERRRRGALGVVAAASVLACAGVLANPTPPIPAVGVTTLTAAGLPVEPWPAAATPEIDAGAFDLETVIDAGLPDAARVELPPPSPTGTPAAFEALNLPPPLPPKDTGTKARSPLIVREDPYDKGFTHPTRLANRQK